MWKKLSSKKILSHKRIVLIEHEAIAPTGEKTDYLTFEYSNDHVTMVCKRDDGKILVQKENSFPINKKIYQFPGGGMKSQEKVEEGANRELMEESNLCASKVEVLGSFLINNRRSEEVMYVCLGTELKKDELNGDPEEKIENYWFSEEEIEVLIKNGEIINSPMLSAWAIYKARK